MTQAQSFKKYAVKDCDSIVDFLFTYHKSYKTRGPEYEQAILGSHIQHMMDNGFDIISKHDSKTGEVVSYSGEWH